MVLAVARELRAHRAAHVSLIKQYVCLKKGYLHLRVQCEQDNAAALKQGQPHSQAPASECPNASPWLRQTSCRQGVNVDMMRKIIIGQSHGVLLCFYCRNALRKHYVTLRENLHIAVKNADAPYSILVSPELLPLTFNSVLCLGHPGCLFPDSQVGAHIDKTIGQTQMRVL